VGISHKFGSDTQEFQYLGIQTMSDIRFYSHFIDGADLQKVQNISRGDVVLAMKTPAAINLTGKLSQKYLLRLCRLL
jgi:hypothetical protein